MSFHTYVEEILSTGPRNLNTYKQGTKMFWGIIINSIKDNLEKNNNINKLHDIKSVVVDVIPAAEDSVSDVNYRRIPSYIEFYSAESKNCVRIILSTLGGPSVIVGFYSNYEKNKKNNHMGKDTKMVNEFYSSAKIVNDEEFITKLISFILGGTETPYVTNKPDFK